MRRLLNRISPLLLFMNLSGCTTGWMTGAELLYERHHVYHTLSDYQLNLASRHLIYQDNRLKKDDVSLSIDVFKGDILITGVVPSESDERVLKKRLNWVAGYDNLFNYVTVTQPISSPWEDSLLALRVKATILSHSGLDPIPIKAIATNQTIYILGHVFESQAKKLMRILNKAYPTYTIVDLMHRYQQIS